MCAIPLVVAQGVVIVHFNRNNITADEDWVQHFLVFIYNYISSHSPFPHRVLDFFSSLSTGFVLNNNLLSYFLGPEFNSIRKIASKLKLWSLVIIKCEFLVTILCLSPTIPSASRDSGLKLFLWHFFLQPFTRYSRIISLSIKSYVYACPLYLKIRGISSEE